MVHALLHDPLSLNSLHTALFIEDVVPCYLARRSATTIADTNKTTKDDKYPWLTMHDQRLNMTDREIIEWKVNIKDSRHTKDQ